MTPHEAEGLPHPPRRASPSLPLVLAAGMGVAIVFGVQGVVRQSLFSKQVDYFDIVVEQLSRWMLYAILAPLVAPLVERWPFERGRVRERWGLYAIAGVVFAGAHSVGMGVIYRLLHVYPPGDSIGEAISRLTLTFFGIDVVVFAAIAGVFHALRYHREVRLRDQLAAALRQRVVEARLDQLRAQLNPHFLFNTLNAISAMAYAGERDAVVRTLSVLSELLRAALDRGLPQEIALARELELLEGYLEIQRVRFGPRLEIRSDIAADAREARFPSLMLQPLVENALRHGLEARPGPGAVVIVARRDGGTLRVRVEDTGPGFGAGESNAGSNGIGLSNSRARLEALYGERQALTCGDRPGGGAYVEVTLPWHTDGDPGDAR